ncbi:MAG: hypothetical protein QNK69_03675 [Amylibacter sp.]
MAKKFVNGAVVNMSDAEIAALPNIDSADTVNVTFDHIIKAVDITGNAATATNAANATTATRLQTARNITLTGDASGTVSFDGSSNVSIATTVTNINNITSSQFSSAVTLNIRNSAGTIVKTIKSPGS